MKRKVKLNVLLILLLHRLLFVFLFYTCLGAAQIPNVNRIINYQKQSPLVNIGASEICGTDFIREEALKQNALVRDDYYKTIKTIQQYISNKKHFGSDSSQYRIPVVVHVIHNGEPVGTGTNISDAQIQSQMDRLNAAFDNIGGGINSVFTDITFCFAENGSSGSTVSWPGISGVNRIQDAQTNTGLSAVSQANLMSVINWPSNQFLNIWLVSTINGSPTGVIGYAPQPLTGGPLDGIVIQTNVFGDNSGGGTYSLLPGYDLGMTMVHEAGHYLGLYHTFQGASCSEVNCNTEGDLICDTPPTKLGSTCSTPICSGAQIENYMDYTFDACKNTYTLGQKDWMEATINTVRSNLVSPENLTLTGVPCAPPGLLAEFTQTVSQICANNTVNYTATTTSNTATSFLWTFPGGTPSTATGVGPHTITYNTSGDFDAILETNDGTTNLVNTSVNAVYVTDCGTGITGAQAQWYFQQLCAVDFTSGAPVGFIGSQNSRTEGAASVCDAAGNLEFYTDGRIAWNASGTITNSLRTLASNESPAQGAVIIPAPNSSNNYYVFNNPGVESALSEGIRYSLYEGVTQNFPTILNQAPLTNYTVTEHLAAAPHCNGSDFWIIYHGAEAGVNDKFLAYQVTSSGVSNSPVISDAFFVPEIYSGGNDWIGQIDIAPNGRLMAATNINSNSLFIYEINRTNGQITLVASTPYTGGYGVSFSPNSEFLYVAQGTSLRQYKVNEILVCGNAANFKELATSNSSFYKSLQIGPDGKIYMNRNFEPWLDVINYPNEEITITNPNAIGYNDYGVFLPTISGMGKSRISLPNMIDVPLGLTDADFDFCITNCGEVQFHNLSCGDQFSWDFGDTNTSTLENPSHTYTAHGTYNVTFTNTTQLASGEINTSSVTKTITIDVPDAVSIVGPTGVNCPTPVNQFAQYSPSTIDPNLEYYWTIIGGTLVGSNPTNVAYVDWSAAGSVELLAINPITGCENTTTINVSCGINPCEIDADFNFVEDKCKFIFSDQSSVSNGVTLTNWEWTVNGTVISNTQNFTYEFPSNGTYLVCLTIIGDNGDEDCKDEICETVEVKNCDSVEPCEIDADFDFMEAKTSCNFYFSDQSSVSNGVTLTNWEWTVNGTVVSNNQNFTYEFPSNGVYLVCLITYGNNGIVRCRERTCKKVRVQKCIGISPKGKQIKENKILKVWPNPSNGIYNLNINVSNFNAKNITIYDMLGKKIDFETGVKNNSPYVKLNASNDSGVYFLMLKEGEKLIATRIVKH